MKSILMALIVIFATSVAAYSEAPQQSAPMPPGMMKAMPEMPMMPCMAMMKQAMGHDMMIYEMMQTMKDIIAIQERLMEGAIGRDRKRMLDELSHMKERVDRMMTELAGRMKGTMTMPAAPQATPEQLPQGGPHQH